MQLVPLWSVPFVPTQDGPAHLEITAVMRRLAADADGVTGRYLKLEADPEPNWLVYLPLAAAYEALTPRIAEKVLLSFYALALPLAALYAARAVAPAGAAAAFLALPLVFNFPLHMGFYNFSASLPLFLVTLGWWWRRRAAPRASGVIGLALLLVLVYAAHPVTWVLTLALLGVIALWDLVPAVREPAGEDRAGARRRAPRRLGGLGLAAAPSVVLMLAFLGGGEIGEVVRLTFSGLVKHLLLVYSLVSYQRAEVLVSVATGVVFLTLVGVALWRRRALPGRRGPAPHDALLAAAGLFLLIYFLAPLGIYGGGYVNQRVQLFVLLTLVPWLAGERIASASPRLLAGAGGTLALAALALHAASYHRLAPEVAAYHAAAAAVPDGSTVLPLTFAPRGEHAGRPLSLKVSPFENALGYTVAERPLVDLANYQAGRGYFPVVYQPQCDPHLLLGTEEPSSEAPRLDGYAGHPGCSLDYVLLWRPGAAGRERDAERVRRELRRQGFRRLALPPRTNGRAELWGSRAAAVRHGPPSELASGARRP